MVNNGFVKSIIEMFQKENVKVNLGPVLHSKLNCNLPVTHNFNHEYSELEITIEMVNGVDEAINHINKHGSNHTESIITNNCIFFIFFSFKRFDYF